MRERLHRKFMYSVGPLPFRTDATLQQQRRLILNGHIPRQALEKAKAVLIDDGLYYCSYCCSCLIDSLNFYNTA